MTKVKSQILKMYLKLSITNYFGSYLFIRSNLQQAKQKRSILSSSCDEKFKKYWKIYKRIFLNNAAV